jgi:hypothetical protein
MTLHKLHISVPYYHMFELFYALLYGCIHFQRVMTLS